MKILALDPGGTTGWATCTLDESDMRVELTGAGGLTWKHGAMWACGQLGPEEHHSPLWDFLCLQETEHDFTIVCESFEYRNRSREGLVLVSCEYIGIVKLFAQERDRELVFQTAHQGGMDKGNPMTAKALKRLDLYNPGWKHANDAMAHLLNYILKKRLPIVDTLLDGLRPS